jgi:hypothetical protein
MAGVLTSGHDIAVAVGVLGITDVFVALVVV